MLGALWRLLEKKGRNPEDYIPRHSYHPGHAAGYTHRLSFEEFGRLHRRVADEFQEQTLGLQLGACVHPSHLGALGYAFLASSSLRTAFYRVQRFVHMVHGRLVATIDESPGHMRLSWELLAYYPYPHQFAESRLAGALTMARMNFGDELRPVRVSLTREHPGNLTPWEEFFGCSVSFASEKDSITFAEGDMRRLLTTSNRDLVTLHEEMMERQSQPADRSGLFNRARATIVEELPTGRITEAQLAARLHMSPRTLRRRLREHGQTFRSVLAEVRKDLAQRYVRQPDYRMTEIAFLLGFSDSSAFSRAYRDWFGESPSMTRRAGHH